MIYGLNVPYENNGDKIDITHMILHRLSNCWKVFDLINTLNFIG